MKICLNYYGQIRDIGILRRTFKDFIQTGNENQYHIIWTTWKTEDVSLFKHQFPNSYTLQYEEPNMDNYKYITSNYNLDITNNQRKTISHYVKGLYIKSKSIETITKYEKEHNIDFDMIITLRCDTIIHDNHLYGFYEQILENAHNTIFLANGPRFAIYNEPADADSMFIANKQVSFKMLAQIDILPHCVINNTIYFHPETAFTKAILYLNLRIIHMNIRAFPQQLH